jgi:hypothetical protein
MSPGTELLLQAAVGPVARFDPALAESLAESVTVAFAKVGMAACRLVVAAVASAVLLGRLRGIARMPPMRTRMCRK